MSEIVNMSEVFGKNVFNETVMKERIQEAEENHRGWYGTGPVYR